MLSTFERGFVRGQLQTLTTTVETLVRVIMLARVSENCFGSPLQPVTLLVQENQVRASIEFFRQNGAWPTMREIDFLVPTIATAWSPPDTRDEDATGSGK